jgi:hypothetical protein
MFYYSAFTAKGERNCHFPAPGWNCMTHRQALHKNNKINIYFIAVPARSREVTVALNFSSE